MIAAKAARSEVDDVLVKLRQYVQTTVFEQHNSKLTDRVVKVENAEAGLHKDIEYVSKMCSIGLKDSEQLIQ